jgi:hypothetical protein
MQARNYTGPGVIVQDAREIEVMCFYEVISNDGGVEWHGEFREAPSDQEPEPGEAKVRTKDQTGAIMIVATNAGIGSGRFEGSGPAPS